ncbi:MAG: prepilin-type N-terminal cleavage/methylation domain-containing protein [Candidatus Omnitrophica bacterium]|jgi:prepilin-type N-terminal cleavage/methylation domain-containing protein|nr:prepilin-type N-terminal cleavage/methylation domain-containing protein [Candidatus Omnitrophota bacterium]MDD5129388.1 prepilin-type N-terminal cleavage/methylation domain-containing protein [Candidatus Omnitrophota bacterium]
MKKGFTLIELIVVIIIVGILASVGMTQYTKVVEKGRAAEARLILGSLRTAEIAENMENGAYTTLAGLGVAAPSACTGTHYFSYSCASATGTCTATRCTASGKSPQGATAYTKTVTAAGAWGGDAGY